jgi:hypothetical protein
MPVTTREYNLSRSRPKDVLQALHDAFTDLGWHEPQPYGYLSNFINTPGSTLANSANERYLVNASSTTASAGTGAVFDVLRSPVGGILSVTLVTGGEGYYIRGTANSSTIGGAGANATVSNSSGINVGMVVNRIAGTGTLVANTVVAAVINSTAVTLDPPPSVALSQAVLSFADTLTIAANSIGGRTYSMNATGVNGQTNVVVANTDSVFVGQRVTGTGIANLAVVTAVTGNAVTLSKTNVGTVSGTVQFSDEIVVITTGTGNIQGVEGFAFGNTIIGVASNTNIYVGAAVEVMTGTPTWDADNGRVFIGSITGSGPYTINLRNEENTFKGFDVPGNITFRVSSGSTVNWMQLDNHTAPQSYAWAIAKVRNSNDRLGATFWHLYVGYNTVLYNGIVLLARPLSGWNFVSSVAQGVSNLDWIGLNTPVSAVSPHASLTVASSPYVATKLRTRQSSIDTNFVTFSFVEGNNTRSPFFFSKYNSAAQPWTNYNDVFLGGITEVFQTPLFNTSDAGIQFRQRMSLPKRVAEAGYSNYNIANTIVFTNTLFRTVTGNRILVTPAAAYDDLALYSRQTGDIQTSVTTTIPVYKTLPINPHFVPVPYYLPDDFVLVEIPWGNPSIGDTITVSPSEIYTIIQVATNQTTFSALALAVRTT